MAYILGALESPNGGAQKCIGKWLRENDSFKKYRKLCILFAIIGSFCFVLPHSCLQSICRTQCQLLNAFLISSIQHPRPELTALQWIRPMAKWHPLQSSVLDDKCRCEFTISLLDSEPPFEGLIEGLFENVPKLFWPCCRHLRATKDSSLDRKDFQLQYGAYNKQ